MMFSTGRWAAVLFFIAGATAEEIPGEYAAFMKSVGRQGDYKANVLKVNIPRNDVKVTIKGVPTPTPFGFGGWLALTKGAGGHEVMMGDLVLLEHEVNPVMSALLDNGLEITALHNHFFFENPRVFYMHVHGHGLATDLADKVKPGLDLIGKVEQNREAGAAGGGGRVTAGAMDTANIARIAGHEGETNGQVYKITVGREDLKLVEMGAAINARMGLNSWASFFGSDSAAQIAGDLAMTETELTPVLKALRAKGLDVVAIHNHMAGGQPMIYFLHYMGTGPAERLAAGFRAALDQLGTKTKRAGAK